MLAKASDGLKGLRIIGLELYTFREALKASTSIKRNYGGIIIPVVWLDDWYE